MRPRSGEATASPGSECGECGARLPRYSAKQAQVFGRHFCKLPDVFASSAPRTNSRLVAGSSRKQQSSRSLGVSVFPTSPRIIQGLLSRVFQRGRAWQESNIDQVFAFGDRQQMIEGGNSRVGGPRAGSWTAPCRSASGWTGRDGRFFSRRRPQALQRTGWPSLSLRHNGVFEVPHSAQVTVAMQQGERGSRGERQRGPRAK